MRYPPGRQTDKVTGRHKHLILGRGKKTQFRSIKAGSLLQPYQQLPLGFFKVKLSDIVTPTRVLDFSRRPKMAVIVRTLYFSAFDSNCFYDTSNKSNITTQDRS